MGTATYGDKIAVADRVVAHPIRPRLALSQGITDGVSMTKAKRKYTKHVDPAALSEMRRISAQKRNGTYGLTPTERFYKWVHKTESCWLWTGRTKSHGYAAFRINGRLWRAHRFAWTLASNQDIPAGMVICHRCDNPKCVNPEHLFLGTQADNIRDTVSKGRARGNSNPNPARGAAHGQSKLTANQVSEIRHAHENGALQVQLAAIYGVSQSTISDIVRRKKWK